MRYLPRLLPAALASTLLLAACSAPPQKRMQAARPAVSSANMISAIHAAGAREKSVIDVNPLSSPGTDALRDAAQQDAQTGRYAAAAAMLDQALKMNPESPGLLQERAEMAIWLKDYPTAERLARQSWSLGPKLGPLCARNWQTIVETRQQAGDQAGMLSARKGVESCHKAGIHRY